MMLNNVFEYMPLNPALCSTNVYHYSQFELYCNYKLLVVIQLGCNKNASKHQARLTYIRRTHANGRRHVYMLKNPFRQLTDKQAATDRRKK